MKQNMGPQILQKEDVRLPRRLGLMFQRCCVPRRSDIEEEKKPSTLKTPSILKCPSRIHVTYFKTEVKALGEIISNDEML
jgi:hypothetical protein